ncbi:MAG: hypothetical protein KAW12_29860 [Candidatus Aminicenantes bacterium]|nr:hypothetical protein [Candidatus Aminicenantes bacterium]
MNNIKRDDELILLAIEALAGILPEVEIHPLLEEESTTRGIELNYGNKKYKFEVIVKRNLSASSVLNALVGVFSARENRKNTILVSEYLTRNTTLLLKKNRILFMDTAGNAYLKNDDLLIFTNAGKRDSKAVKQKTNRAFYASGLKLIFNVLAFPGLVNAPYRTTAKISKVSLGSIGWVYRDLKEMGHLLQVDRNHKKTVERDKLFEKWTDAYGKTLRPGLLKGRYRPAGQTVRDFLEGAQDIPTRSGNTFLGGETAAYLCTGYLKPETLTLYTAGNILDLIKTLKLVPDESGPVEILELFWDMDYYRNNMPQCYRNGIVPYHLIYADLIIAGDERNLEGAKQVYEEHLRSLL